MQLNFRIYTPQTSISYKIRADLQFLNSEPITEIINNFCDVNNFDEIFSENLCHYMIYTWKDIPVQPHLFDACN